MAAIAVAGRQRSRAIAGAEFSMSAKPEILFLAHRIPYPPDKGDKIRSWRLLKHLTQTYAVHLACFVDEPDDFSHAEFLRSVCASVTLIALNPTAAKAKSLSGYLNREPLSMAYYRSKAMHQAVDALRARPLVAEVVFSSTMAQYIETPLAGRKRIIDFCDADSEKWLQYAQDAAAPLQWIFTREGRLLAHAETDIANWADASFAITPAEAALFNRCRGLKNQVAWWSNGVDTDYFDPAIAFDELPTSADVVFVGAMDYRANVKAATYFAETVWPLVLKSAPDARFAIVGANPVRQIRMLDGKNRTSVTGRVDDVRPWLGEAKIVVAPLRVARGIQNKVLEAMAMARPVVATTAAATGLGVTPGEDILIADKADIMAQEILLLLGDSDKRHRLGVAARRMVRERYRWGEQLKRFDLALGAYSSSSMEPSEKLASSA
jgi:sugar transferase (PEP-CTERM/EpsH1 system associated)